MKKSVIFVIAFAAAVVFANDYTGSCAPALGINKNGVFVSQEPTFWKSLCTTIDELNQGVRRYLAATNQTARPYVLIEEEHWFVLHFTD